MKAQRLQILRVTLSDTDVMRAIRTYVGEHQIEAGGYPGDADVALLEDGGAVVDLTLVLPPPKNGPGDA